MIVFQVSLLESSYPILLGEGLLQNQSMWEGLIQGRAFCIVTDETVAPLYLNQVCTALHALPENQVIVPAGESSKNIETLQKILSHLTDCHFPRDGVIVALGGGVIGDMAGFAASIYQRGTDFIQVPTTTLAMLDSSIGGKTAVNLGSAKNNIGAFHQPEAVVMDLAALKTLSDREYQAGLAEAVKHALIRSPGFFAWLQSHQAAILKRDPETLARLIEDSCDIKAKIVKADEREANIRMLLNLGHTFGHAVEAYSDYQDYKHGEAVSIGTMLALEYSARKGLLKDKAIIDQTRQILQGFGLPTGLKADYNAEKLLELMQHDKKKRDGKLNLVLLKEIGDAVIYQEQDLAGLKAFLITSPTR